MKPLKGKLSLIPMPEEQCFWMITIPGRAEMHSEDNYASKKSATTAAKRFAARCNIELEQGK